MSNKKPKKMSKKANRTQRTQKRQNNVQKQNKQKRVNIGQTLETNDIFLPHDKPAKPKSRPVIVVDKNKKNELVIVPGSKEKTPNTKEYHRHGIKLYRLVIEVEDNEGKPIKVNEKFQRNEKCTKLPINEALTIRDKVLNHSKNSSENRLKYEKFNNRYKKK